MKRLLVCLLLVGVVGCGNRALSEQEAIALLDLTVTETDSAGKAASVFKHSNDDDFRLDPTTALVKLERFSVSGRCLTATHLRPLNELPELKVLSLDGTHVGDAGLVHLKGMTKLKHLQFGLTQVTDAGETELKKALPNCAIYGGGIFR